MGCGEGEVEEEGIVAIGCVVDKLGGFELSLNVFTNSEGLLQHDPTPITNHIPAEILSLNKQEIVIDGFMQPVTMEDGRINEFLLMRDRATCCFGGTPEIHHWIHVKAEEGLAWAELGVPVRVCGILDVEEMRSDGVVLGIYKMNAKLVERTQNPKGVIE